MTVTNASRNRVEFTYDDKKYACKRPTQGESLKAQQAASVAYATSLKNGIITRVELEKIARERNLFGEEFTEKLVELNREHINCQTELFQPEISAEDRNSLASRIRNIDNERTNLIAMREAAFGHTCEGIAQMQYMNFVVAQCTVNEDGTPVWCVDKNGQKVPSFDMFLDENDEEIVGKATTYMMGLLDGFDPTLITNENGDYVDRLLEEIDKSQLEEENQPDLDDLIEEAVDEIPDSSEESVKIPDNVVIIDKTVT